MKEIQESLRQIARAAMEAARAAGSDGDLTASAADIRQRLEEAARRAREQAAPSNLVEIILRASGAAIPDARSLARAAKWADKAAARLADAEALAAVMTAAEAVERYNLSPTAVRAAIRRGSIAARQSGKTWLITRREAEALWGGRIS